MDCSVPEFEERTAYHLWCNRVIEIEDDAGEITYMRNGDLDYFTRFMLRLAPTVDIPNWKRMNYESRRSALLVWRSSIFSQL